MSVRNLSTLDRDMFQPLGRIIQEAFADGLIGTGTVTITKTFTAAGTTNRAMYLTGNLDSASTGALWGMYKFRTYVNNVMTSVVHTLCANLHFKDAAEIVVTSGHWNSALYATVETEVTTTAPDLSGGSVAALSAEYYVDESTGAPAKAYVLYVHAGTYNWDGLVAIRNAGDLGESASGGDEAAHVVGFDGDGSTIKIPIDRAGTTYYLLAGTAIQNVADA